MVYKTFTAGDGTELSVWVNNANELVFQATDDINQPSVIVVIPKDDTEEFCNEIKKLYSEIKNG